MKLGDNLLSGCLMFMPLYHYNSKTEIHIINHQSKEILGLPKSQWPNSFGNYSEKIRYVLQ